MQQSTCTPLDTHIQRAKHSLSEHICKFGGFKAEISPLYFILWPFTSSSITQAGMQHNCLKSTLDGLTKGLQIKHSRLSILSVFTSLSLQLQPVSSFHKHNYCHFSNGLPQCSPVVTDEAMSICCYMWLLILHFAYCEDTQVAET